MTDAISNKVAVFVEPTPNPNSLKFIIGKQILESGSYDFDSAEAAAESALAKPLFAIAGVAGVFLGSNFVAIRKNPDAAWSDIEDRTVQVIEDIVSTGVPVVKAQAETAPEQTGDMSPAEITIRKILDEEVRPAVASDGGDVVFRSFDTGTGVLTLQLVGACSGCPSSTFTLKMGIERRLKEDVPELTEVISMA